MPRKKVEDEEDLIGGRGGDGRPLGRKDNQGGVAADQLRAFVERIERLEEEKAATAADIREVYAEAKGNGFDVKILRRVVKTKKRDFAERMEEEAVFELYMNALGLE
jgi:uncharacterized protein (UPF0335 family)